MPERIFIIEFLTADAARQWYQSDDYQEGQSQHCRQGRIRRSVVICRVTTKNLSTRGNGRAGRLP